MPRGLVIFLIVVALIAALGFWGLPAIKSKLFGESMQVRINTMSAVDAYDVDFKGTPVSRTVAEIEVFFPMGGAPETHKELYFTDADGKKLDVAWASPDREDIPDRSLTRWYFKEVYFPIGFRQGRLHNKYRDLGPIWLSNVTQAAQN
ncbi:MAG TPA: hypothetical protein VGP72_25835 [Planctomycetota bacterium]